MEKLFLGILFFTLFFTAGYALVDEYFFRRAKRYIENNLDLIEVSKYQDDEKKLRELFSESVAVRIGLALRRAYNALAVAGQEITAFKDLSDEILSVNWRNKTGEIKRGTFSLAVVILFPISRSDTEKNNARKLEEAISELRKLHKAIGHVSHLMNLSFFFKVKLVKKAN